MGWLEKLGIADAAKKNIRQLSKGMAQRTGLAHCLACKPEVLILDEPLSGLDPIGRIDVVDLLVEYHAKGGTLLFTSHVLHDVERIADSFALIKAGTIIDIKTSEELLIGNGRYKVVVYGSYVPAGFEDIGGNRSAAEFEKVNLWKQLSSIESSQLHLVSVTPTLNLENLFLNSID
jgi:ABC-2 type transport system ATP-binding protein